MATTYLSATNAMHGRKRKRGGVSFNLASKLSRRLFFKGTRPAEAQISPMVFDRAVNRVLKRKNISEPEQKFHDTQNADVLNFTTPGLILLNAIALGDTVSTRAGTKIRVTKIELSGTLALEVDGPGSDSGKLSLFIHKQANATAPAFASTAVSNTAAPYSTNGGAGYPYLKHPVYANEFYIIKDWDFILDANAGVSGAWQLDQMQFRCSVDIDRVVEYNNNTAGTVADIIKNAIYFGHVGSAATGVSSFFDVQTRIWYTDM